MVFCFCCCGMIFLLLLSFFFVFFFFSKKEKNGGVHSDCHFCFLFLRTILVTIIWMLALFEGGGGCGGFLQKIFFLFAFPSPSPLSNQNHSPLTLTVWIFLHRCVTVWAKWVPACLLAGLHLLSLHYLFGDIPKWTQTTNTTSFLNL